MYLEDFESDDLEKFRFRTNKEIKFILSEKQIELIKNFIQTFGNTKVGISRILSRVYVKKLFRFGIPVGSNESINSKTLTQKSVRITGLQN